MRKQAYRKKITLIPGDGIGTEITASVMGVFGAAKVPIDWEIFEATPKGPHGPQLSQELIASISRNKVALKGMSLPSLFLYTRYRPYLHLLPPPSPSFLPPSLAL
jgi:isocitrate/isopropylmalate dehydrogenase